MNLDLFRVFGIDFGRPRQENKHVIFTGNGYSAEWPVEANKRGLPNLNTTPTLDRFHMI